MALSIDRDRCTGCPAAAEPPCVRVCPGDLLVRADGRIVLREPEDCWDCASCVKACPRAALGLVLPVQLGGRGSRLTARTREGRTRWLLRRPDGQEQEFET